MIYLSTLMLSLFITLTLIPPLRQLALWCNAVDIPNERKVHCQPIPKVGGLAMSVGFFVPVILWAPMTGFLKSLIIASGVIVLFGFLDDIKELKYGTKLAGQMIAAGIVVIVGGTQIQSLGQLMPGTSSLPGWIGIPLTMLAIVGVTNAINLADGLDGLAGGIALLSFMCLGYLAFLSGLTLVVVMSAAIVGSIIGFLRFNTYPATIFMGDTGSQLLGFTAICLCLHLTQPNSPLSPMLPLVLLGFPVLDTLSVMAERITNGRSPFKADKNHFHHKLIRLGFSHSESVLTIYTLQALLVTTAYVFRFYSDWILFIFYSLFSMIVITGFLFADKRGWCYRRLDLVDTFLTPKIKFLRQKHAIIRICFKTIEYGIPSLFFITCMIPSEMPFYSSLIALLLGGALVISIILKKWTDLMLRMAIYLTAPFLVFKCDLMLREAIYPQWFIHAYALSYLFIALFVVLTLKYTRRRKGFRVTPMDFIVLFTALVVPNLPDPVIRQLQLGFVTIRIITFLFSYEVLIGELRGELRRQGWFAAVCLFALAFKGIC